MSDFIGKSGKFYAKNPFGGDKYTFAVYPSKADYDKRSCLPDYVSSADAFLDYEKDMGFRGYEFKVWVKNSLQVFRTTFDGVVEDGDKKMKDILASLYDEHGKENIKFNYQKIS